jgi:hypothetical protein
MRPPLSRRLTEFLLYLEERRSCGLTLQPESVQGLARLFADMIDEARGLEHIVDLATDAVEELRAERAAGAAEGRDAGRDAAGAAAENVVAFPAAPLGRRAGVPFPPDPKGAA